jgi:hypothetical protein
MEYGCSRSFSDEAGTVALGTWSNDGASGHAQVPTWELYHPDGSVAGFGSGDDPQPLHEGFVGLNHWEGPPGGQGFHFSFIQGPDLVQNQLVRAAAHPKGGAIAVERPWNVDRFWLTAHRYDGKGQLVAPPADVIEGPFAELPRSFGVTMAEDGWSLVVFTGEPQSDPGGLYARWIDPEGAPAGSILNVGARAGTVLWLKPLGGDRIGVRVDGVWVARVRRLTAEPPPAWLSALRGRDVVPLSRGYAVPFDYDHDQTACATAVELRSPAGNLCHRLGLHDFDLADVGADGTLIVREPEFFACKRRWWSRLLR